MARRILMTAAAAALALAGTPIARAAMPGCATENGGGDWRMYGGTLAGTRAQTADTVLDATTVGDVASDWVFDAANQAHAGFANGGTFQNTPVVADGCVYLTSSTGGVFALNATTGDRVWSAQMPGSIAGGLQGGVITGSPTVTNGRVYVAVSTYYTEPWQPPADLSQWGDPNGPNRSPKGPYVAALDQATGDVIFVTPVIDTTKGHRDYRTTAIAAPVVWRDVVFQGLMGDEGRRTARGGYAIVDATTGELLIQDWTITDAEYAVGHAGASIWCTAAVEDSTGYAYACGGNPVTKTHESRYSNALMKIDLDRSRATFGQIVDSYKGTYDNYYPGAYDQPACEQLGDEVYVVWSQACLQLDLDFGASPNLFKDSLGRTLVGALQKSGIYHAVYADNLSYAWTSVVAPPCFACNASSSAVGADVYVVGTPPGQLVGLGTERGTHRWVHPIGVGGTHFQSVSTANGVVYTINNLGELIAVDAATGLPVLRRPLMFDTGDYAGDASSQGVAIAQDRIFATSSSFVVAYGLQQG